MPGRGPQTFKKRQREQQRKERQQEKMAERLQRKEKKGTGPEIAWDEATTDNHGFNDAQTQQLWPVNES